MNDPKDSTRVVLMILCVCIAVIMLLLFGSCRTIHDVERIEIHDTLTVHHTDTVKDVQHHYSADTTTHKEYHYYMMNDSGKSVKEFHYYHDNQKTIVVDSTNRYQAKVDSLQRIINEQKDKERTIVKEQSWWNKFKYRIGLFLAVCCVIFLLWYSFKDKIIKWLKTKI